MFTAAALVSLAVARMGYGSSIRMAPAERVAVIVLTNRTGADLRKTEDKAFELLLPLQDAAAASGAKAALPVGNRGRCGAVHGSLRERSAKGGDPLERRAARGALTSNRCRGRTEKASTCASGRGRSGARGSGMIPA
jgi:hypothetical protein